MYTLGNFRVGHFGNNTLKLVFNAAFLAKLFSDNKGLT